MNLSNLPKRTKRVMPKRRIGRGYGSTSGGHTVGRGMKGQKSRSGYKSMVLFEGGNTPFFRRMPKLKGFKPVNKKDVQGINVSVLEEFYKSGEIVNLKSLLQKGLIKKRTEYVKILGDGDLTKKLEIEGIKVSASAREKIVEAKGVIKE